MPTSVSGGTAATGRADAPPAATGPGVVAEGVRRGRRARVRAQMGLPNYLTILRLLMIPVIAAGIEGDFRWHDQVAAATYGAAAATDTLDGWIARHRRLVTDLGKFLDPLVDKVLVVTVLAVLLAQGALPFWVVIVIVAREFLITGLRSIAASKGVVVASTPWGKSKTLSQNTMIALLILQRPFGWLHVPAEVFIGIAVTATVMSGLDYVWRYRRFVV